MRLFLISLLAFAAGCGPSKLAGASCTESSECSAGSTCLEFGLQPADGGACGAAAKTCTKTCSTDSDCAGLTSGSVFKCSRGCSTQSYCASGQ